jgi:hypothetical protein
VSRSAALTPVSFWFPPEYSIDGIVRTLVVANRASAEHTLRDGTALRFDQPAADFILAGNSVAMQHQPESFEIQTQKQIQVTSLCLLCARPPSISLQQSSLSRPD